MCSWLLIKDYLFSVYQTLPDSLKEQCERKRIVVSPYAASSFFYHPKCTQVKKAVKEIVKRKKIHIYIKKRLEKLISSNMMLIFVCWTADPALFLHRTVGGVWQPNVIASLAQRCGAPPGDVTTSPAPSPCFLLQSTLWRWEVKKTALQEALPTWQVVQTTSHASKEET